MAKLQKFPLRPERASPRWTTSIGDTFKATIPLLSAGVALVDHHFDTLRAWCACVVRLLGLS